MIYMVLIMAGIAVVEGIVLISVMSKSLKNELSLQLLEGIVKENFSYNKKMLKNNNQNRGWNVSIIEMVSEDICDNYCSFKGTADEGGLCDAIRDGKKCPLDTLRELRL